MAIYTKHGYGTPVENVREATPEEIRDSGYDPEQYAGEYIYAERARDGAKRIYHISDLRADDGRAEIMDVAKLPRLHELQEREEATVKKATIRTRS